MGNDKWTIESYGGLSWFGGPKYPVFCIEDIKRDCLFLSEESKKRAKESGFRTRIVVWHNGSKSSYWYCGCTKTAAKKAVEKAVKEMKKEHGQWSLDFPNEGGFEDKIKKHGILSLYSTGWT